MAICLRIKGALNIIYEIGTADFFHCFFSNISYYLENKKWGSKYPVIMTNLYEGKLKRQYINSAINELNDIQDEFKKISPLDVIWDIDDLSLTPPWGNNISSEITSLSNYFVTSDGRDLFHVIHLALQDAKELNEDLSIE